jgi:hypothetical protein
VSSARVTLSASVPPACANKAASELMHLNPQEFQHNAKMVMRASQHRTDKKREGYTIWHQFNEKPSMIPGCPELHSIHNHNNKDTTNHTDKQLPQWQPKLRQEIFTLVTQAVHNMLHICEWTHALDLCMQECSAGRARSYRTQLDWQRLKTTLAEQQTSHREHKLHQHMLSCTVYTTAGHMGKLADMRCLATRRSW